MAATVTGRSSSRRAACDHRPMPDDAPEDLSWGAFSDDPPWVLDRDALVWRTGVPARRAEVAREIPRLTAPSRWPPGLRVGTVTLRLGAAILPWIAAKRLERFKSPEAGRAD